MSIMTNNITRLHRDGDEEIVVETSCGKTIRQKVSEMTDRQLRALLEQNADSPDAAPWEIAALRAEVKRRAS
jgi:hypothetical protein